MRQTEGAREKRSQKGGQVLHEGRSTALRRGTQSRAGKGDVQETLDQSDRGNQSDGDWKSVILYC